MKAATTRPGQPTYAETGSSDPWDSVDQFDVVEHREVQADDDRSDDDSHDHHEERLQDRRQVVNRLIHLGDVEVGDPLEHVVERTGLLANLDHLDHQIRKYVQPAHGIGEGGPLTNPGLHLQYGVGDDRVAGGVGGDVERFHRRDTGGEKRREGGREPGQTGLVGDWTEDRWSHLETVPRPPALL